MTQFTIELARKSDESNLRNILEDNPIEGDISLSFQRNPNFFHAIGVQGKFNQIVIARKTDTKEIIGFGTRSIKPVYLNGKVCDIGYLSGLRLNEKYRRGTLVARGYRYFKDLHKDGRTPIYITTIIESNLDAKRILTSKKAGLPAYNDFGLYYLIAINLLAKKRKIGNDINIINGSKENLEKIMEFINKEGPRKQFFPYYSKKDFISGDGSLRDLNIEDFYIAVKKNKIVGVMAKWDQTNFKQSKVINYKGKMKFAKPFYNFGARIFGYHALPNPGDQLRFFYTVLLAIESDDPEVFRSLLNKMHNDSIGTDYSYFLVGLHSKDPLLKVIGDYHHIKYTSHLYIVCWQDGETSYKNLDGRIPYLEIGTL